MNQSVLNSASIDLYKSVNVLGNLNTNVVWKVSHTGIVPLYAKGII